MNKFFLKFGHSNKKIIRRYVIIGLSTGSIIAILSFCSKINENHLWDFLDDIQRKYFPQTPLNDIIINDPQKLERRIRRDVDKAIEKVTPEYDKIIKEADQKYQPKYIEKPIDESVCYTEECKSLGGEMRICAPWVENCN
jgi:hypothetical protein